MDYPEWCGVELRHLTALAAVVREGSFRNAANRLGYVQSAVSRQVAELEDRVGARLIERSRGSKSIRATPEGELLVEHANEILARMHAARTDLMGLGNGGSKRALRIGVPSSMAAGVLPGVLGAATSHGRGSKQELIDVGGDRQTLDLVERGEVDVAFAELPLPDGAFASRSMFSDPFVLLFGVGSEWAAGMEGADVAELAQVPLIAFETGRSTDRLKAWFAAQGYAPQIVHTTANEATLRAFVAAGVAAAIVPRLAVEPWDARLVATDLDGVPRRQIALVWHSERIYDGGLEAFCEVTARMASEFTDQSGTNDNGPAELTAAA